MLLYATHMYTYLSICYIQTYAEYSKLTEILYACYMYISNMYMIRYVSIICKEDKQFVPIVWRSYKQITNFMNYRSKWKFQILQAPVVKKYPAKLTLTSFTCFFGLIQFLVIAAFVETDFEHWKIQSGEEIFTILYAVILSTPFSCNIIL